MAISFYQDIYPMLSKKYPNRKIYVIGDHHFDHNNIIRYSRENFPDVDSMNAYIINCHNKIVNDNDIVLFLGDFGFKNNSLEMHLSKMNGHKYLILGNHDNKKLIKTYHSIGFEGVFMTPIKIQDSYLSHEPLNFEEKKDIHFKLLVDEFIKMKDGINYHGYIHTYDGDTPPYSNVTCEALGYEPLFIGYTGTYSLNNEKELLINSKYFDILLEDLQKKHNLNPKIVIADYIYSTMLEANQPYYKSCFINGSFALYKKYDFISNFSDLDIALMHNLENTKAKSFSTLRDMTDSVFEHLKSIDGINLHFYKRYDTIRIFESFFTSHAGHFIECDFDANIIPYDFYRDSDFIVKDNMTVLEKYLKNPFLSLPSEYHFPNYTTQFLVPNGDISNLLLQILFQDGFDYKKSLAIKR